MPFKYGDKVRIKDAKWSPVYIFISSRKDGSDMCFVKRGDFYAESNVNHLELAAPVCPVCNQEVVIENKKVKEHSHNNELCYGSYVPYV